MANGITDRTRSSFTLLALAALACNGSESSDQNSGQAGAGGVESDVGSQDDQGASGAAGAGGRTSMGPGGSAPAGGAPGEAGGAGQPANAAGETNGISAAGSGGAGQTAGDGGEASPGPSTIDLPYILVSSEWTGDETEVAFSVILSFPDRSLDPEGLEVRYWFEPEAELDEYSVHECSSATVGCDNVEYHLREGNPPWLSIEVTGGSNTMQVVLDAGFLRSDGSPVVYTDDYSYQAGGPSENQLIGVYYRGEWIWGKEP